jgi:VanZ family protein
VRNFIKYWVPVLILMASIFTISTDLGSSQHTSRIIGPLLRWFNPDVSEETIHAFQVVFRKTGHMSGYALLALFFWRALHPAKRNQLLWVSRVACNAFLLTVLYACTDELHQSFVPTRDGQITDVLIDGCGAFAALLLIWVLGRWRSSRASISGSSA